MRYQGKITSWKDDQGFGFITPNGSGDQVFLHIKAFSGASRRPVGNEIVTYELTTDERRRPRATNVAFVGKKRFVDGAAAGSGWGSAIFVAFFCIFMVSAVLAGKLSWTVLALYLGTSVIAFFAYAFDKSAAHKDQWRTRESTLHMFGLIGGWPGALIAQKVLRHKSRKPEFRTVFRATVIANCGVLLVYASPELSRAVLAIFGATM